MRGAQPASASGKAARVNSRPGRSKQSRGAEENPMGPDGASLEPAFPHRKREDLDLPTSPIGSPEQPRAGRRKEPQPTGGPKSQKRADECPLFVVFGRCSCGFLAGNSCCFGWLFPRVFQPARAGLGGANAFLPEQQTRKTGAHPGCSRRSQGGPCSAAHPAVFHA